MLSPLGGEFFLRANIWPSRDEHMFRASGGGTFVYELPHDHNFDFLTWAISVRATGRITGNTTTRRSPARSGEPAGLRFVERSRLEPGKLMHYRAHRDVHSQLPPDALSVSLNVMHAGGAQGWIDQYRFDVERRTRSPSVLGPARARRSCASRSGWAATRRSTWPRRSPRSHPATGCGWRRWRRRPGVMRCGRARRAVAPGGGLRQPAGGAGGAAPAALPLARWPRSDCRPPARRSRPAGSPPRRGCRSVRRAWRGSCPARSGRARRSAVRPALVPQQHRQAQRRRGCGHRRGSPGRAGPALPSMLSGRPMTIPRTPRSATSASSAAWSRANLPRGSVLPGGGEAPAGIAQRGADGLGAEVEARAARRHRAAPRETRGRCR